MRLLFVLLCVCMYLFGVDISFNKKFKAHIIPDELSTNITISTTKEDETDITPILTKFNNLIIKNTAIKKEGGKISIYPKYQYTKGTSNIIGYNGKLRYRIFSSDSETINKIIKDILELKDDDDTSITISSLNWRVSDQKYTETIEELRLQAILWAKQYTTKLSAKMHTQCIEKAININGTSFRPRYYKNTPMVKSLNLSVDSSMPIPQQTKNSISINPSYLMECK